MQVYIAEDVHPPDSWSWDTSADQTAGLTIQCMGAIVENTDGGWGVIINPFPARKVNMLSCPWRSFQQKSYRNWGWLNLACAPGRLDRY